MTDFPSNSKHSPQPPKEEPSHPKLKPVTSGATVRKKRKPLGKQVAETFIGGDLKTTAQYVVLDVAIPSFKDLVAESMIQGIERLIFGEVRVGRRHTGPVRMGAPGPQPGRIQYQNYAPSAPGAPAPPRQPRQRQRAVPEVNDFVEVVISSRPLAETVLERMTDVLDLHGFVSVADFYSLVDLQTSHTDNNYGWTDLKGSSVSRNRDGGYLINLPDPAPFSG